MVEGRDRDYLLDVGPESDVWVCSGTLGVGGVECKWQGNRGRENKIGTNV